MKTLFSKWFLESVCWNLLIKCFNVSDWGDNGEVTVLDHLGHVVAVGDYNGKVVVFRTPVALVPGQTYSMSLKGVARTVDRWTHPIKDNSIISGNTENWFYHVQTLYYWQ